MSKKLEGKIAVVTGGSEGIGLATAKRFAAEGAYVFITGRRQEELDKAVKEIGANAKGVRGDVGKLSDLDNLYNVVKKDKGRIDVLFANAGVFAQAPLAESDEAHFDHHFDINVKGLFFTVQKAFPLLSDGASVLLTGSVLSLKGFENFSVYSATKAAVRSFARTWTSDLKARKIRVNVVSPGPIVTPGFETMAGAHIKEAEAQMATHVPLGRMGKPEEVANVALFLASDESSYVAGTEIFVDGGAAAV